MLLIESGMILIALLAAFLLPNACSSIFAPIERRLAWLAGRRRLAVLAVGAAALGLRAAVLPVLPIPYPGLQDEFSYQLMADTFAHVRLTNPTHPLWIHLESLLVIHTPTYCSMYYPGQGIFMALGQVIGGHPFWGVWLSVGLMCAAICWMLQGWVPPFWALIGGLLAVIRIGAFSYWADSYWGGAVAALGGALVLGALPRIKRQQRIGDALLMGIGFALLVNSRPYESSFFGIPIFLSLLVWMVKTTQETRRRSLSRFMLPLALVTAATGGFMAYYFWRTTGGPLTPPYIVNLRRYAVDPNFAWLPLRPVPHYNHDAIRRYYAEWDVGTYQAVRTHPLLFTIVKILMLWFFFLGPLLSFPFLALGFVIPYGKSLADVGPKTRFLAIVCGTTLLGLLLAIPVNPHYAAPITAAIYALVVLAMQRVRRWRSGRKHPGLVMVRAIPAAAVALLFLRVAIPILHLPVVDAAVPQTWCSPWYHLLSRRGVEIRLRSLPGEHLVLVHYDPQHDPKEGWISNSSDIDGSKIVWAYDMGPQNKELIRYFAGRHVWLVEPDQNPINLSPYEAPKTFATPSEAANQ